MGVWFWECFGSYVTACFWDTLSWDGPSGDGLQIHCIVNVNIYVKGPYDKISAGPCKYLHNYHKKICKIFGK